MKTAQKAIFELGSDKFSFLEFKLVQNVDTVLLQRALANIVSLNHNQVGLVTSLSKLAWNKLQPPWEPDGFTLFESLKGLDNLNMPSTQNDLFFWIHSTDPGNNFDMALEIKNHLQTLAELVIDQNAFTYHDSRDFTGFEDGTANPKNDKRYDAALIPKGLIGEGGSFVFTQKWIHDLNKFNAVPVKEQEAIVGRTKAESIELEGDEMPVNSHVSRTDVKMDGEAMKIYRRSAPFGNANEHGLFFLAFACHPKRIQIQLERMLGSTEDGITDRIMEFSTPVTGSYWFAPSEIDLINLVNH